VCPADTWTLILILDPWHVWEVCLEDVVVRMAVGRLMQICFLS
jgi:hypothetical protein